MASLKRRLDKIQKTFKGGWYSIRNSCMNKQTPGIGIGKKNRKRGGDGPEKKEGGGIQPEGGGSVSGRRTNPRRPNQRKRPYSGSGENRGDVAHVYRKIRKTKRKCSGSLIENSPELPIQKGRELKREGRRPPIPPRKEETKPNTGQKKKQPKEKAENVPFGSGCCDEKKREVFREKEEGKTEQTFGGPQ